MKNQEYTLFLDMDGVLVDFDRGYLQASKGRTFKEIQNESDESDAQDIYFKRGVAFWTNLEWIRGGKELYQASTDLFADVCILSSSGTQDPQKGKMVETGKRLWLKKNIPNMAMDRVFIVPGKERKPDYANKTSILVDDMSITIKWWNAAGGFGILHNSKHYEKTIEELEDIARPIKLSELAKRFKR